MRFFLASLLLAAAALVSADSGDKIVCAATYTPIDICWETNLTWR